MKWKGSLLISCCHQSTKTESRHDPLNVSTCFLSSAVTAGYLKYLKIQYNRKCNVLFINLSFVLHFYSINSFVFSFVSLYCVFVIADHVRKPYKVTLTCDTVTFSWTMPENWPRCRKPLKTMSAWSNTMIFRCVCVWGLWDCNVMCGFAGSLYPVWDQNHLKYVCMRSQKKVME